MPTELTVTGMSCEHCEQTVEDALRDVDASPTPPPTTRPSARPSRATPTRTRSSPPSRTPATTPAPDAHGRDPPTATDPFLDRLQASMAPRPTLYRGRMTIPM